MPEPLYYLQLVDRDGKPVTSVFVGTKHRHGTVAIPIIEEVLKRVGWWRSKKRIEKALQDAIHDLKDRARYI